MKLLLDENLPHDLRHFLPGHQTFTVAYMGWSGVKNGELLRLAADDGFDALLSLDSGLAYQHNLQTLPCSVLIIRAASNRISDLQPLLNELLDALISIKPMTLVRVG
jgi:predicted nuclease of predicted toxin-antitoxin system